MGQNALKYVFTYFIPTILYTLRTLMSNLVKAFPAEGKPLEGFIEFEF